MKNFDAYYKKNIATAGPFTDEIIWKFPKPQEEAVHLSDVLGLPHQIAQVLVNRKIHDPEAAHRFLYGSLEDLSDPYLMAGMHEAVSRVRKAISDKERVLIFGDYDVDGVLSVVILVKALESLGARVDYFIPDRLKDGYGIKSEYIQIVKDKKAALVISVDCGIKAVEFVRQANDMGVDVIITDHHRPGPSFPEAYAVLNPVINGSGYPGKNLAGIGVVFKLIQALFDPTMMKSVLSHYLKMVSIGTIADVVSLKEENRIFVKFGLKGLERVANRGLASLMEVCGLKGKNVGVGDVGFRIGPRINAAGRMGKADLAVRLFLSDSIQECRELAHRLNIMNSRRQEVEQRIFDQALERVRKNSLDRRYRILILGCETWHRGVIGIVASKLKDHSHRPVILFSYENGKAFGSGRSISEFSLIECLEKNNRYCINFGGHPMAVGCELSREEITGFKQALNVYSQSKITDEHLKRKINIDASLQFKDINSVFLDKLFLLAPFGLGNPRPFFLSENIEILSAPQRLQERHSKMMLKQDGKIFEGLGWGKSEWTERFKKGDRVNIVYSLQFSEYQGEERMNLSLEDMKPFQSIPANDENERKLSDFA